MTLNLKSPFPLGAAEHLMSDPRDIRGCNLVKITASSTYHSHPTHTTTWSIIIILLLLLLLLGLSSFYYSYLVDHHPTTPTPRSMRAEGGGGGGGREAMPHSDGCRRLGHVEYVLLRQM